MKRLLKLIPTLVLFLSLTAPALALELTEIRQAIASQGARWKAAETAVSVLPVEERLARLGLLISNPGENGPPFVSSWGELPERFDWRDSGVVSPITNQGNCGSCWAFATIAALESLTLLEGLPTADLSEQFLVSYNRMNSGCRGGVLWSAASFVKRFGTVLEECMPYRANGRLLPPACPEWRTDRIGALAWQHIPKSVESLKNAVYEAPVAAGFYVYEDFDYYESGIYSYVSGAYLGGHAILIVGWDDVDQCFIAKNSWGPDWGEAGFFRVAYSEVNSVVLFGSDAVLLQGIWPAG